jgi:hypothetical protein
MYRNCTGTTYCTVPSDLGKEALFAGFTNITKTFNDKHKLNLLYSGAKQFLWMLGKKNDCWSALRILLYDAALRTCNSDSI